MTDKQPKAAQEHCSYCDSPSAEICFMACDFDSGNRQFALARCSSCNLVRTSPIPTPELLSRYYSKEYYGGSESKFSSVIEWMVGRISQRRARHLIRRLDHGETLTGLRVLDIGCGRGTLLKVFAESGAECHGIERTNFPGDLERYGVQLHRDPVNWIGFADGYFDIVVIWHTLEHLYDPLETLRECGRILRPGGIVSLAVPNFGSWQARLFKQNWFHLDLPRHLHHFTRETLLACADAAGLSPSAWSTFSVEQNVFGFVQSTLNRWARAKPPNLLYASIKSEPNARPQFSLRLALHAVTAGVLFPLALLEHLISGIANQGATLTLVATRPQTKT